MENTYSITVTNKFSLTLDEDEDPIEILKRREQECEARRKEKLSEKENRHKHLFEHGLISNKHQQQNQQSAPNKQQPQQNKSNRSIKDNAGQQQQQQPSQQSNKTQDLKNKDQGDKKISQQRGVGIERNVKFFVESQEERNNKRNREENVGGDRLSRMNNDMRRGSYNENREMRERREAREPQESRDNRESCQNREIRPSGEKESQRCDFGDRRGGRSIGRGTGRGRGGPRNRVGLDSRGKREFDRQSGSDKTGIKSIDKKDGAGSHNWGTHNDEIEESMHHSDEWVVGNVITEQVEQQSGDIKENSGDAAADVVNEEKPAEEESRELTLDEWKALRGVRAKPQFNERKAGEGEDLTKWKKMYVLDKRKDTVEEEEEDDEEYNPKDVYPQRVGRQKHVLDIEIQFNDTRRSIGGRGGRGGRGSRGGRDFNRGFGNRTQFREGEGLAAEQRSTRERQNAPKVDDEHDFPSLG